MDKIDIVAPVMQADRFDFDSAVRVKDDEVMITDTGMFRFSGQLFMDGEVMADPTTWHVVISDGIIPDLVKGLINYYAGKYSSWPL